MIARAARLFVAQGEQGNDQRNERYRERGGDLKHAEVSLVDLSAHCAARGRTAPDIFMSDLRIA